MRTPADGGPKVVAGAGAEAPPVVAATGLTCDDVAGLLPGMIDGTATPGSREAAHVGACLRCQAELARYRRLLRLLRSLGAERVIPGPGGLAGVLSHLEAAGPGRHQLLGRRVAYVGGMVVATAASAAGVLVWASRRRELAS